MSGSLSSGYKEYMAGMFAGVATVIVGHPFDTVKVKLQKHNTEANGVRYKNGFHCTARILKTEGVKGLYRGATPSFLGMAFESSLAFGIYSQTKQFLQVGSHSKQPQFSVIFPSGAFAGAIISFILCPSELVKCRMQVQGADSLLPGSRRYAGPLDCALETVKNERLTGLFRGGFTTFLRESMGNAVFFSTYEHVRYHMHRKLRDSSSGVTGLVDMGIGIVSGGLGGIACWSAVLPLDVAKTKIQTAPDRNHTRNPFRILKSIYRRSGLKGCYTGLGPTVVRAFPANAAAIVTWEMAVKMLGIRHD
ncbi:mitochondrial arginine transporter BAC1 [Olea europaea var. sylvestris]|uniref:Mitochondrial arginine transporter BAC1 isoform X1 n=2 Tax=Olea europaea subsp. europaea TaxID=158383 RepID=A0A8S0V2M9_OLEEU|nr:mitochondrial arginine transporter BAC1 [Olea europaea var. sylvestris]CAA3025822.1 mitochondrial arginine transporter BAC1 isoform X1 [Olea europaea subsp. europaea]